MVNNLNLFVIKYKCLNCVSFNLSSKMRFFLSLLICASTKIGICQNNIINTIPQNPISGKEVKIVYEGALAKLDSKLSCVLYYSNLYNIYEKVIPSQFYDNKLIGTFTLPDSVAYFSCKISNRKQIDNNSGKGYGFNVFENDKPKKNTFLAEGYFSYLNKYYFGLDPDYEKSLKIIEKEIYFFPESENRVTPYYLEIKSKIPSHKIEAIDLAMRKFNDILKTGIGDQFTIRYANIIGNGNIIITDSLKAIALNRFPKGLVAINKRIALANKFSLTNPDSTIKVYYETINQFPKITLNQEKFLTLEILTSLMIKNDTTNFNLILKKISDKDIYKLFNYSIASKFNEIANTFIYLKDFSKARIFSEISIQNHLLNDSLSGSFGNSLDTFAEILFKTGQTKKAIFFQKKAMPLIQYLNTSKNQNYVEYLIADNQYTQVKAVAETFISENLSTKIIDSCYILACNILIKNSNESDFKKLKETAKFEFEKELKMKLINIKAPYFSLKDLSGKEFKLSDLNGKIVILDFWATWCSPCIKSFPAMKKVISEFEGKNIIFLFIDTLENENNSTKRQNDINIKIQQVLKNQDVSDFIVLKDEIKNNFYSTTSNYNVSAIPSKFVIDKKGNIRYTSVGFSSDENLIKEISSVIRILNLEDL